MSLVINDKVNTQDQDKLANLLGERFHTAKGGDIVKITWAGASPTTRYYIVSLSRIVDKDFIDIETGLRVPRVKDGNAFNSWFANMDRGLLISNFEVVKESELNIIAYKHD